MTSIFIRDIFYYPVILFLDNQFHKLYKEFYKAVIYV